MLVGAEYTVELTWNGIADFKRLVPIEAAAPKLNGLLQSTAVGFAMPPVDVTDPKIPTPPYETEAPVKGPW
jgi:hypothetical protein